MNIEIVNIEIVNIEIVNIEIVMDGVVNIEIVMETAKKMKMNDVMKNDVMKNDVMKNDVKKVDAEHYNDTSSKQQDVVPQTERDTRGARRTENLQRSTTPRRRFYVFPTTP